MGLGFRVAYSKDCSMWGGYIGVPPDTTYNPAWPWYSIAPQFPRKEVLRVVQNFEYLPYVGAWK